MAWAYFRNPGASAEDRLMCLGPAAISIMWPGPNDAVQRDVLLHCAMLESHSPVMYAVS
jgi:hypothetical protein